MSLYSDLPVFRDAWQLALRVFEYTKEFGREHKYTLGRDMKRDSLQLVRHLYRANKAQDKRVHLEVFLDDYEFLKLEIRMAAEMRLLSMKKAGGIKPFAGVHRQTSDWLAKCQSMKPEPWLLRWPWESVVLFKAQRGHIACG